MKQQHFLHPLYQKYFSKKEVFKPTYPLPQEWQHLSDQEKKEKAVQLVQEGEIQLLKGNLEGLKSFDYAVQLDSSNAQLWHKQGLCLYEYGMTFHSEKILKLAKKNFKIAINLEENFQYWWSLANLLFELASLTNANHYFQEAKDIYIKTCDLAQNQDKEILAELYWDTALAWSKLAQYSGEGIDVKKAIQTMRLSFAHQKSLTSDFWFDFGSMHMQMALLINENRIYLQAIDYFQKACDKKEDFIEALFSIAQCNTGLYINTLQEKYFLEADKHFAKCYALNSNDIEFLMEWAALLGEAGRITNNCRKLRLSIEKCNIAFSMNTKEPLIIGQWAESLSILGFLTNRVDYIIEAEKKMQTVIDIYSHLPELWYAYGMCMMAFANYYNDLDYNEMAIEKFETAIVIDPLCGEAYHLLANCYYELGKNLLDEEILNKAIQIYKKACQIKPAYPALNYDYAKALLIMSDITENVENIQQAVQQFEITLQFQNDPLQNAEWLFHYAIALDLLGEITEEIAPIQHSVEIYHHVLLIDPDLMQIYYRLGVSYSHLAELSFEMNYFHQAFKYFDLALKQNREDDQVYLEWGLSLITFAQYNDISTISHNLYIEAEKKLITAAQLGNQAAYYHLACLYAILENKEKALYFLQKAEQEKVLPSIDDVTEDEWLENLHTYPPFELFLQYLQTKQHLIDEK